VSPGPGGDAQVTVVALHDDPPTDVEPQAGPLADRLGVLELGYWDGQRWTEQVSTAVPKESIPCEPEALVASSVMRRHVPIGHDGWLVLRMAARCACHAAD
jgi:hypothetical protein